MHYVFHYRDKQLSATGVQPNIIDTRTLNGALEPSCIDLHTDQEWEQDWRHCKHKTPTLLDDGVHLWRIMSRVWLTAEWWPVHLMNDFLIKVNVKLAITLQFIWRNMIIKYVTIRWKCGGCEDEPKRWCLFKGYLWAVGKKSHGISKIRSYL